MTSRFTILTVFMMLAACSKIQMNQILSDMNGSDLFSNRPQTQDKVIVLLKLKNPPLLSTVTIENGTKTVNADLKKAIQDEQNAALEGLSKISSSIQLLYKYKMVLNGLAVVVPTKFLDQLPTVGNVSYVEQEGSFSRPQVIPANPSASPDIKDINSVNFIGVDKVHKMNIAGEGVKIGIIDTGIDYTHAMMMGPGTAQAYKAVNPSAPDPGFPNQKVVGGTDFVGSKYNAASADFDKRIPIPDTNPLDEQGHGSHVAGTVGGIGDGINTYDGVAPKAQLYALKVFGAEGSTGDAVVIAALEYAAEASLDVVNLSLGSPYGSSHNLYTEAIGNLTKGGTVAVISAGNSGQNDYIVGAPSVADDAISVAASIDNSDQNWKFPAVKFILPSKPLVLTEAVEATFTKSVDTADVSGPLVLAGLGDKDFDNDLKSKVQGKVAFMDRGSVSFEIKIDRALAAGAIGVVVTNNQPGLPFKMYGKNPCDIPAIMISQSLGDVLKDEMKKGDVIVKFKNTEKIERPELIDTITGFSSKGPRSFDGIIKPEISSPGQNVISAEMGSGFKGIQFSGTSMAAPHITGVMALLKEAHPDLTPLELKSLLMETAKSISDTDKMEYSISIQGAGRVRADLAVLAKAVTKPAAISLGEQNLAARKTIAATLTVKNISKSEITINPKFHAHTKGISLLSVSSVKIAAGDTAVLNLRFRLDSANISDSVKELDGFISLNIGSQTLTIPVLAIAKQVSLLKSQSLIVHSSSEDSAHATADLKLANTGHNPGEALIFNLLGLDTRKANPDHSSYVNTACDLQAVGYRIIQKNTDNGVLPFLQVAIKLYQPQTSWDMCEVSVLIDKDGDGVPEQELGGIALGNLPGLAVPTNGSKFASVLLDAAKTRNIRKQFELASGKSEASAEPPVEDYRPAMLVVAPMMALDHSTVAVIEAPVQSLAKTSTGELSLRVATSEDDDSTAGTDDFLEKKANQWTRISIQEESQSFSQMPEIVTLNPGESLSIPLNKEYGSNKLMVLMPQNSNVYSDLETDGQMKILIPQFKD